MASVTESPASSPIEVGADLLSVRGVSVSFGGVVAINNVTLRVPERSILGMVGPNGAGKSTLMNVISGLVRTTGGSVIYGPKQLDLTRLPRQDRARLGIARTFQHSRLFSGLTVIDQLMCGAFWRRKYGLVSAISRLPPAAREESDLVEQARSLLEELGLIDFQYSDVSSLPAPHRRLVDLGRGLMFQPRLLLLDEIAAGMTDVEKGRVIDLVKARNLSKGVTVVVIEHDLEFVRALAEDLIVMAQGRVLASGATAAVLSRDDVLRAYVGE